MKKTFLAVIFIAAGLGSIGQDIEGPIPEAEVSTTKQMVRIDGTSITWVDSACGGKVSGICIADDVCCAGEVNGYATGRFPLTATDVGGVEERRASHVDLGNERIPRSRQRATNRSDRGRIVDRPSFTGDEDLPVPLRQPYQPAQEVISTPTDVG